MRETFRKYGNKVRLNKFYFEKIISRNGRLIMPLPKDIIKAFNIKSGDLAIWEFIDKRSYLVRFARKGMCSVVESIKRGG